MIIVSGEIQAKDGCFDPLLAASLAHCARSRTEPGCITHECSVDPEREGRIVFFERWEDRASLDVHFNTEGAATMLAAMAEFCVGFGDVGIYQVTQG